uniref:HMA domain-containing protein n=1 Tax=Arundo donax TaxID=35708 RepID=A0A0A8XN81_ARUDO
MHATGRCMFLCSGCRETPESRLMVWLLKLDLEINLFVLFISNFFLLNSCMAGFIYGAGVTSFSIDLESKKVTVMGHVSPAGVLESISKVKKAELLLV